MKRLLAFLPLGIMACAGSSPAGSGSDRAGSDSGLDRGPETPIVDSGTIDRAQGTTPDASPAGGSATNADAGAGALEAGATCDPNAGQCGAGLTCCGAPKHPPPGSYYFCYQATGTGCPAFP